MTTDADLWLVRWNGVTEPMTVLTNTVLGLIAFVLGVRLAYGAAAAGMVSSGAIAFGLLGASLSAFLGAVCHGIDPMTDRAQRDRMWRAALCTIGLIGAASVASVAYFSARGPIRVAILAAAGVKLVVYLVNVTRRPEFRIAVADYGGALAVLFGGAVYAFVRWRAPGAPWLVGSVLVSLVGGIVQARRAAPHRHFNHNDLYHVIQVVALYLFYRGGALLVDR